MVTRKGRFIQMANVATEPRYNYHFNMEETLAEFERMDKECDDVAIIWHSHPNELAAPSLADVRYAMDPSVIHVIVGCDGMRAWRIHAEAVEITISDLILARDLAEPPSDLLSWAPPDWAA